ncbi:MAG: hypothetical protein QOE36_1608, partial [Gaiellaceae bacterium]|nr:hypothetical protein [Gaiellaceae bacterium]
MSGLTMPHAAQRRVLVAVRGRLGGPASFVGIAAAVGAIAAANGGFFPSSWGWAALGFSWVALLTLLLARDVALDRLRVAFAGALTALAAWVWLSGVWTPDLGATIFEGERMLVYVTGLLAVLLLVRRTQVATLLGGLLAAATVVAAYSLATRLFPGRIGSFNALAVYRLAEPLGYWNALGILCVFGVLLALGLATFSTRALARASAGSSLPVLLATLYFTYSRGSWIALAVGFMVAVAVSPARLRLITGALVLAAAPALVVLESSRSDALTHSGARLAAASHEGHRLALIVLLAAAVEAGVAVAVGIASERLNVGRSVRLAYGSALVLACLVAFAGIWIAEGSPYAIAKRGYHAFATRPPSTPDNLNQRLLNFSGNGRTDLWQVAWQEAQAHPALGGGAGSYEGYWLQHRTSELHVVDAHNPYLETLAELGPVGLALLALSLGIPLAAAIRARRHPLVAAAVGVYAAFLV